MIKKITFAAIAGSVFMLAPTQAQAQVQLGPTVAFHDDFDFGVGAMVGFGIPALGEGVNFLGDFTVFFPDTDNLDYWEINGNVTYDIPVEGAAVAPFLLGGLNVAQVSIDAPTIGDTSETELGLNLGGGLRFAAGTLEPIVGARVELSGGEGFVVFASLPFNLGG